MRSACRRLAVLTATAALLLTGGCVPLLNDTIEVTALLEDSAGLFVGNDVGVLGVPVGEVTSITPRGEVVAVRMEIDSDVSIPADAGAVVVARSVATDRYVELTPVYAGGATMAAGDTIGVARTRTPVEFDELLASLGEFSEGLAGPDGRARALRRVLASGADALDGRGRDLRETLDRLAVAAGSLSAHREDITGTVRELDALVALLAGNSEVVDQFITSVTDATALFAAERRSFGRSLRTLSRALHTLATFVREHRTQLGESVDALTEVTVDLLEHQAELAESVENLPLTFDNIGRAVSEEGRLRVKLPLRHLSPVQEVTDQLCSALPPVVCENLGTSPDLAEVVEALLGGARR